MSVLYCTVLYLTIVPVALWVGLGDESAAT